MRMDMRGAFSRFARVLRTAKAGAPLPGRKLRADPSCNSHVSLFLHHAGETLIGAWVACVEGLWFRKGVDARTKPVEPSTVIIKSPRPFSAMPGFQNVAQQGCPPS
jgi:hypothetical protein